VRKLARAVHAPTGRVSCREVGERKTFGWIRNSWRVCIGWLDFNYLHFLSSIISMEIIFFFFFTKIHDFFFSINRDLDHLIWTQKKNQVFHSLNLIISISFEVLVFD
jgi:hypothetical protein